MSAEKLESCDDFLMAILIRMPPKSVYKFMLVSRRWKAIITSTYFCTCYEARLRKKERFRLLAFIQTKRRMMNILPAVEADKELSVVQSVDKNMATSLLALTYLFYVKST